MPACIPTGLFSQLCRWPQFLFRIPGHDTYRVVLGARFSRKARKAAMLSADTAPMRRHVEVVSGARPLPAHSTPAKPSADRIDVEVFQGRRDGIGGNPIPIEANPFLPASPATTRWSTATFDDSTRRSTRANGRPRENAAPFSEVPCRTCTRSEMERQPSRIGVHPLRP